MSRVGFVQEKECPKCRDPLIHLRQLAAMTEPQGLWYKTTTQDWAFIVPLILLAFTVWLLEGLFIRSGMGLFRVGAWPPTLLLLGVDVFLLWFISWRMGYRLVLSLTRGKYAWSMPLFGVGLVLVSWLSVMDKTSQKHFSGPWDSGEWGALGLFFGAMLLSCSMLLIMLLTLAVWLRLRPVQAANIRRSLWLQAHYAPDDWVCPHCLYAEKK